MRASTALLLAGLSCVAGSAAASDPRGADGRPEAELTAREIYSRVLGNRFRSSIQEMTLVTGRGGRSQPIRVQMLWRRYAEDSAEASEGILSRSVVRYLSPSDVRRTGYLVVDRDEGPDDQFVYLRSLGRIRRVHLREATLFGTDLAVEDLVPRELDSASYRRAADGFVGRTSCYVVEATPRNEVRSAYSRFRLYVDMERYVPLRVRYFDRAGVETKELRTPVDAIREVDGHFVPIRMTMRNLLEPSATRLYLDVVVANPELPSRFFSQRQLVASRLQLPKPLVGAIRRFQ